MTMQSLQIHLTYMYVCNRLEELVFGNGNLLTLGASRAFMCRTNMDDRLMEIDTTKCLYI